MNWSDDYQWFHQCGSWHQVQLVPDRLLPLFRVRWMSPTITPWAVNVFLPRHQSFRVNSMWCNNLVYVSIITCFQLLPWWFASNCYSPALVGSLPWASCKNRSPTSLTGVYDWPVGYNQHQHVVGCWCYLIGVYEQPMQVCFLIASDWYICIANSGFAISPTSVYDWPMCYNQHQHVVGCWCRLIGAYEQPMQVCFLIGIFV